MTTAAVIGDNTIIAYYIAEKLIKSGRDVILLHPNPDPEHPLLKGLPFLTINPAIGGTLTVDEAVLLTGSPVPLKCKDRAVLITPHPYKPEHADKETGKIKEDSVLMTDDEQAILGHVISSEWCVLRTGEIYGNGIEDWIMDIARKALQGSAIVVYPRSHPYLMVFNLVEIILDALTKPEAKNQIINVADNGASITEQGLANAINVLCNNSGDVKIARSQVILRKGDESVIDMDLTKMEQVFGPSAYQTIVGLRAVLQYALDTMSDVDEHTRAFLQDQLLPMNVR